MSDVTQFLALDQLLINELIGDVLLFVLIALAIIIFISLKNKVPFEAVLLLGFLFVGIVFAQISLMAFSVFWVFIVLISGLVFYYNVSKAFKRG